MKKEKWQPKWGDGFNPSSYEELTEVYELALKCGFKANLTLATNKDRFNRCGTLYFRYDRSGSFSDYGSIDNQFTVEEFKQKLTQHMDKEKYEFKNREGIVCSNFAEIDRAVKLLEENGYPLFASSNNTDYWHDRDSVYVTWNIYFNSFYCSWLEPIYPLTCNEAKRLITGESIKVPLQYSILGGTNLTNLFKKKEFRYINNGYKYMGDVTSCYYNFNGEIISSYSLKPEYKVIRAEEFEQILIKNKIINTMKTEEKVIIPMEILAKGLIEMNPGQRAKFIPLVNMVTGETTKENVIACYKEVCDIWKRIFEGTFPWLLDPKNPNVMDMLKAGTAFCTESNAHRGTEAMIHIRNAGEYKNRAFYLNDDYTWEIVDEGMSHNTLVPTRK